MRGKDGLAHAVTLEAASAFDVVDKATDSWSPKLFNPWPARDSSGNGLPVNLVDS